MNNLCVFLTILLLGAVPLQGQSYRPFLEDGRHSYFTASDVQSVVLTADPSNPNSVFWLNRTIEKSDSTLFQYGIQYLLDKEGPFGTKMEVLPNGVYLFTSNALDSLFIHTQAALNTPWTFLSDSTLTAQIFSKTFGDVNDVTDSLIYISISDGQQIVIGKEKGMLLSPNFSAYFNGKNRLEFMAYEDPRKTVVETFFDFPLNARFYYLSNIEGVTFYQDHYQVTARQFLNDGSFASYTLDHISKQYTQYGTDTTTFQNTVTWTFSNADYAFLSKGVPVAAVIPDVVAIGDTGIVLAGFSNSFGGRPGFTTKNYTIDTAGFLYQDPLHMDFRTVNYVVGLGLTSESSNSFTGQTSTSRVLRGWHIGSDSSGSFANPFGPTPINDLVLVGPVPVKDQINLAFNATHGGIWDISLYNSRGMRVLNRSFSSSNATKLEIPTTGLVPGVYLLDLISAGDERVTVSS